MVTMSFLVILNAFHCGINATRSSIAGTVPMSWIVVSHHILIIYVLMLRTLQIPILTSTNFCLWWYLKILLYVLPPPQIEEHYTTTHWHLQYCPNVNLYHILVHKSLLIIVSPMQSVIYTTSSCCWYPWNVNSTIHPNPLGLCHHPHISPCVHSPDLKPYLSNPGTLFLPPDMDKACDDGDFKCDNGHCIPRKLRCDNFRQCNDGSDERNCPDTSTPNNIWKNITTWTTTTTTAMPSMILKLFYKWLTL